MPPAYLADKQGKPLLSWRVTLLPYLGQEDLYKRFHLDEPWDSSHNRQLILLIPDVYKDAPRPGYSSDPPAVESGKTRFLLLRGPKTVYADPAPPMPRTYEEWLKVIVVEVLPERAVPWTKPEEFTYNAKNPLAGTAGEKLDITLMMRAGSELNWIQRTFPADAAAMEEFDRNIFRDLFTGTHTAGEMPALAPVSTPAPPQR